MLRNLFKLTVMALLLATAQARAAGLPEIVSSARRGATDAFTNLAYYKFQNTPLTNDEIHWLVLYRTDLANDAANAKHNWNVGNYQQCAWTRVEKGAAIDFSQNQCESVIFSSQQAIPILIQMSLVHYGVSEQRSFVMSQVILGIAGVTPPPVPPVIPPNPVLDVFNPAICSGPEISDAEMISYFPAGAISVVPEFKAAMFSRLRVCNVSTGCTAWTVKEYNLPTDGRKFDPSFWIGAQGKPFYSFAISVEQNNSPGMYCIYIANGNEFGLNSYYCGYKVGAKLLTNKCAYSKTYTATEKNDKGSFAEHELVFYGLLGAPKK